MRAILTYHSIDPSGSPISVHPDAFDRHVKWLESARVTVTTIEELVALPASADAVAISFDDGFENFLEVAPRLLARDWPVALFVVSDRVGRTNAWNDVPSPGIPILPLLDWPALARLQAQGIRLGAHSRTHPDLTRLPARSVEEEIVGSADAIARQIGVRPTVFAYPYGRVNDEVARVVGGAFRCACTTEFRVLDERLDQDRLPRLDMYYMQRSGRIESWGTAAFSRFVKLRHHIRRVRQAVERVGPLQIR